MLIPAMTIRWYIRRRVVSIDALTLICTFLVDPCTGLPQLPDTGQESVDRHEPECEQGNQQR